MEILRIDGLCCPSLLIDACSSGQSYPRLLGQMGEIFWRVFEKPEDHYEGVVS